MLYDSEKVIEIIRETRLTLEEAGNLEWTEAPAIEYSADFSFVDDYPKEIEAIIQAQLDKILAAFEDK